MDIFKIDIKKQLDKLNKNLSDLEQKQMPFAASVAINSIAKMIKQTELDNFKAKFDLPTPFTMNAIGIIPAKKGNLNATIFVKDIQAQYLAPYEFGGKQSLGGKKGILTPKDIRLNQYGNIPMGAIALLKAQKGFSAAVKSTSNARDPAVKAALAKLNKVRTGGGGYFIGPVKTKAGIVNGVWQRPLGGSKTASGRTRKVTATNQHLKLIVRFSDPLPVNRHLGYRARAKIIVAKNLIPEFDKALKMAMATRK